MILQNNKYLFILFLILSLLLLIIIYLLLSNIKPAEKNILNIPTPTPYRYKTSPASYYRFSPFQKTIIGKTSDKELSSVVEILDKNISTDGTTAYIIKSVDPLEPDEIITRDNVVVYEKTSTFTNDPDGFPAISSYIADFGKSEKEIKGSKKYGALATLYIYASNGFSLIGNSNTDSVYEIQRFIPMSVKDYESKYGFDIENNPPVPENL